MLVKLNAVTVSHIAKYKTKITLCEEKLTIESFLRTLKLDDERMCNEYNIREVLVSVTNFSDETLLDKESLAAITFGELQKSLGGGKTAYFRHNKSYLRSLFLIHHYLTTLLFIRTIL